MYSSCVALRVRCAVVLPKRVLSPPLSPLSLRVHHYHPWGAYDHTDNKHDQP